MFCPKCKYEYVKGISICPECNEPLVDSLPDENKDFDPSVELCKICSASDEFEADIIISKLKSEGIRAFKKFKGIDGYNRIFLGRTILGVDIIVAENDREEAWNIIHI